MESRLSEAFCFSYEFDRSQTERSNAFSRAILRSAVFRYIFPFFHRLPYHSYAFGLETMKISSKSRTSTIDRGARLLFCNSSQASFTSASRSFLVRFLMGIFNTFYYMESRLCGAFCFLCEFDRSQTERRNAFSRAILRSTVLR